MHQRLLGLLLLLLSSGLLGCGPSKPPTSPVGSRRSGETIVTSCPDKAPTTFDDDLEHLDQVEKHLIDRICVIGALNEENRVAVVKVLGFQEGALLESAKVRVAMEAIVSLKTIEDVSISADRRGGESVVLLVAVKERPHVDEVVFEGSKFFGDKKLSEANAIEKGELLDRKNLNAMIQGFKDEYLSVGYGGVTITPKVEPLTSPGHVRVRFVIKEGPLWKISTLNFPGASKVTSADLKKAVGLTEGTILSVDKVERATILLQSLYYERGMVAARVSDVKQDVTPDGSVSLAWTIDEGDVYKIEKIRVTKLGEKFEREILGQLKTKANAVFDRTRLTLDLNTVVDFFAKKQGKSVEVNPSTDTDPKKKSVTITLEVVERP